MAKSKKKECILVVDDAPDTLEVLQRNLNSQGYIVFTATSVAEAIKILDSTPIDLVITDLKMPKVSGMELIRHVRENFRNTEVMMITGYATIEGAVEAVKKGAEEFLSKPFTDEQKVYQVISKVSSSPVNVLISGESGTGKELVARAIHYSSRRASAPFIPVNCGGIPESLFESELFGYVKGAFTGANETRAGFFQTADGGTIFLDEISETSLAMQVKLLRVLQNKEVCMVGANRPHNIDVRILAATNKDLPELVKKGSFREDLNFRLNVITITIPPLRNRADDILLLINHFANKYAEEVDKQMPRFSDKALNVLQNYYWPGNVRELENVIQRLLLMADDDFIEVADLPSLMRFSALRETGFDRTLAEVEAEYIRNVLASVDGNKTQAAKILGIDRKTLREKLKIQESPGGRFKV
jgi:DNA-binding NtrC family response regulator